MRTFHFQDGRDGFDAFMALQDKYGSGQDMFSTLTGHLGAMAREGALVDVLGPQHAVTAQMLAKNARQWEALGKPGQGKFRPARMLGMEGAGAIDRTYSVLSGRANGVDNAHVGRLLGSARSLMAASSLGSATIPATIGDSVTALLAARYNGMDGGKVLARAIETIFAENPKMQEDAARLLVTGHAMSDHAISTTRYADQMFTPELIKKTSDFVIRASGLTPGPRASRRPSRWRCWATSPAIPIGRWPISMRRSRVPRSLQDHGGRMGHAARAAAVRFPRREVFDSSQGGQRRHGAQAL
jgi:hypothetical protein